MYRALNSGTRQWDIVVLVARRSPITLAEIADETGLARTSTQQQVGRLVSEGWLDRTPRHGKPGRPVDVFSLSDQSRRLFAQRTGDFARGLLAVIADTEGKSKVRSLIRRVGSRMSRELSSRVGGGTTKERLHRLAELLSENGAINDVTRSEGGYKLTIHTCPYHGLSEDRSAFCDMDRAMVSRLVGAKVRARCRISQGHSRCEFELAIGSGGSTE
jgi:predicted ArsR family transcriptional regulator